MSPGSWTGNANEAIMLVRPGQLESLTSLTVSSGWVCWQGSVPHVDCTTCLLKLPHGMVARFQETL
jgi:hypothetical protein